MCTTSIISSAALIGLSISIFNCVDSHNAINACCCFTINSHGGGSGDHEAFPDSSTVTVSAPPPDSSKLCVTWAAENIGYFRLYWPSGYAIVFSCFFQSPQLNIYFIQIH